MKKKSMKHAAVIRALALLVLFTITFNACKTKGSGETEPTEQELALEKLGGTWSLANGGSILVDGSDHSVSYTGFTATLAEGTYNTTNAGELFESSGTWIWLGESSTSFSLDDGKTITITDLTESRLVISFTHTGSGGIANGVAGAYVVTLTK
ncbi:MAG: hypothetical protein HEP71_13840 [Roseivirga sp.]|nr:hypothetical protein [Roseivirga sp.]